MSSPFLLGKIKRLQEAKSEAATEIGIEKKERERRYKLREDEVLRHLNLFNLEELCSLAPAMFQFILLNFGSRCHKFRPSPGFYTTPYLHCAICHLFGPCCSDCHFWLHGYQSRFSVDTVIPRPKSLL